METKANREHMWALGRRLQEAATNGDLQTIDEQLDEYVASGRGARYFLNPAIRNGRLNVVKHILKRHNVKLRLDELDLAARNNHERIVRYIVDRFDRYMDSYSQLVKKKQRDVILRKWPSTASMMRTLDAL